MLENIAVDDEVCVTGLGLSGGGDAGGKFNSGDVADVGFCSLDQADNQVPVIAPMVENTADSPTADVLFEDRRQLCAASLVAFG